MELPVFLCKVLYKFCLQMQNSAGKAETNYVRRNVLLQNNILLFKKLVSKLFLNDNKNYCWWK